MSKPLFDQLRVEAESINDAPQAFRAVVSGISRLLQHAIDETRANGATVTQLVPLSNFNKELEMAAQDLSAAVVANLAQPIQQRPAPVAETVPQKTRPLPEKPHPSVPAKPRAKTKTAKRK